MEWGNWRRFRVSCTSCGKCCLFPEEGEIRCHFRTGFGVIRCAAKSAPDTPAISALEQSVRRFPNPGKCAKSEILFGDKNCPFGCERKSKKEQPQALIFSERYSLLSPGVDLGRIPDERNDFAVHSSNRLLLSTGASANEHTHDAKYFIVFRNSGSRSRLVLLYLKKEAGRIEANLTSRTAKKNLPVGCDKCAKEINYSTALKRRDS